MVSLHSEGMSSFYNQIPVDMVVNIFTLFLYNVLNLMPLLFHKDDLTQIDFYSTQLLCKPDLLS